MTTQFSYELLQKLLQDNKFEIVATWSCAGMLSYMKARSLEHGNELVLSVPTSFPIPVLEHHKTQPLVEFKSPDQLNNHYSKIVSSVLSASNNDVNITHDDFIDPINADKLIEQYADIDIDMERAEWLESIIYQCNTHISRLKFCTQSVAYKLCITSSVSLCCVKPDNTIISYAIKRCNPTNNQVKNKQITLVLNLEQFYERLNNIHDDIKKLYTRLYRVLDNVHQKGSNMIINKINQHVRLIENIRTIPLQKKEYEYAITKLESTLMKINSKNQDIDKELNIIRSSLKTQNLIHDTTNSFKIKSLQDEIKNMNSKKTTVVKLLNEIRTEYNNFVFEIDNAVIENLERFEKITTNFTVLFNRNDDVD